MKYRYIIDLNAHNKGWNLYDLQKSWAGMRQNKIMCISELIGFRLRIYSQYKMMERIRLHNSIRSGKFDPTDKAFSNKLVKDLNSFIGISVNAS